MAQSKSTIELDSSNAPYVERLLEDFRRDPSGVEPAWREYFEQNGLADGNGAVTLRPSLKRYSVFNPPAAVADGSGLSPAGAVAGGSGLNASAAAADGQKMRAARRQDRVSQLIRAYRVRGHLIARLDPLNFAKSEPPPELELAFHGL